jgi:hypothetical protein
LQGETGGADEFAKLSQKPLDRSSKMCDTTAVNVSLAKTVKLPEMLEELATWRAKLFPGASNVPSQLKCGKQNWNW